MNTCDILPILILAEEYVFCLHTLTIKLYISEQVTLENDACNLRIFI